MTVKLHRTSTPATQFTIADGPNVTFPAGDFALAMVIVLNGDMTGYGASPQVLFCNGTVSGGAVLLAKFNPLDAATNPGRIHLEIGSTSAVRCLTPVLEANGAYLLVVQRSSNAFYTKLCPILATAPTDGSAVITSTSYGFTGALDSVEGLWIGNQSTANRRWSHSIGRFSYSRALTDLEIAQLAYGKEITAYTTPLIYLRLNGPTDYADTGSQANTVTAQGTITQGAAPGFGYDSTPAAPVFISQPALAASAVVGVALGYTGGAATGNPSPTITRQWTLSTTAGGTQTDIAGATGATYPPVSGDLSKFVRVRLTATNSEGSVSTTSEPSQVSNSAVELTLISIKPEAIFQREAGGVNGQYPVPLNGSFVGPTPAAIEAQLYDPTGLVLVRSWFDVGAAFDAGAKTYAAMPIIAAPTDQMKYRIVLRSKDANGNVLAPTALSGRFGVGDRVIIIGSSSPAALSGSGSGVNRTPDHNTLSTMYDASVDGSQWTTFDTYGQASLIAAFYASKTGVPTAVVNIAVGGSTLEYWSDPTVVNGPWLRVGRALANMGGTKLLFVAGAAGSNDITLSTQALTPEAHLQKLQALAANLRQITGQPQLPILWNGINRREDALDLQANNARAAERMFGDGRDPYTFYNQIIDIEVRSNAEGGDGIHPTGSGMDITARRMEQIGYAGIFQGVRLQGPVISNIAYSGSKATVTISHRNAGATGLTAIARTVHATSTPATPVAFGGVTGIEVMDDSGAATVTSVELVDSTRFSITCHRALVNPKITYLEGAFTDNAVAIFDNGTTPLPLMADPIGLAGAGAVYYPVSRTLGFSYSIAGASQGSSGQVTRTLAFSYSIAGAIQAGTVSRTLAFSYAIAGALQQYSVSRVLAFSYSIAGVGDGSFARAPAGEGYRPRSAYRQSRPRDVQGN